MKVKLSITSLIVGFYSGRSPVDGERFYYLAPIPFVGIEWGRGRR